LDFSWISTMRIVDIDRVAAAFDQRSVPIALGRTFFIFGILMAAASAWPPSNIEWAGIGISLAGAGLLIAAAFRNPGSRIIRIATPMGAIVVGAALILDAILGVTPAGRITPFDTMNAAFTDALAMANARYGTPPWLLARSIACLFRSGSRLGIHRCRILLLPRSRRRRPPVDRTFRLHRGEHLVISAGFSAGPAPLSRIFISSDRRRMHRNSVLYDLDDEPGRGAHDPELRGAQRSRDLPRFESANRSLH
jgi:hypothetical protein